MAMAVLSSSPTRSHLSTFSCPPPPSPSTYTTHLNPIHHHKPYLHLISKPNKKAHFRCLSTRATTDNGARTATSSSTSAATTTTVNDEKAPESSPLSSNPKLEANEDIGPTPPAAADEEAEVALKKFEDPRWVNGTWDLKQFAKGGSTDWDAVIDAEARRRKWLEQNPESSSNENPVVFDTSIIPWWAWIKKFHLPEAELLNGRAAMIGFFMAYFVDSLTGLGLVDQMGNFFCKSLLLIAVAGVLLIRKNEDIETLKKLLEETSFYDKQWQATWQDETSGVSKKD